MDLKDLFIIILVICIIGIFFFGSVGSFLSHVHNAVGGFANDAEAKNEYFSVDYLEGKTDNPHGSVSGDSYSSKGVSGSSQSADSSKKSSSEFLGFSIDQDTHSIKSSSDVSSSSSSGSKDSGGSSGSSYSSGSSKDSGSSYSSGSSKDSGSSYSSGSSEDSSGSSGSSKDSSGQSSNSNGWFPNIFPNIFPDKKSDSSNASNKSVIPGNDTNKSVIPGNDTNKSDASNESSGVYENYQINYTTDMVDEEGNPVILSIVSTSGNQMEPGVYKVYWSKLGVINQTKIK